MQYIADCFYKEETWAEADLQQFMDEAKTCVQESLDNLYAPSIEEDGNKIRFKDMEDGKFQKALALLINRDLPSSPEPTPTMLSKVKQVWDFITK